MLWAGEERKARFTTAIQFGVFNTFAQFIKLTTNPLLSFITAPVKQLIMEKLPEQARIHQQSKELISNLCMHFLSHLAE